MAHEEVELPMVSTSNAIPQAAVGRELGATTLQPLDERHGFAA
jgi:hypothetical protein